MEKINSNEEKISPRTDKELGLCMLMFVVLFVVALLIN